MDKQFQPRIKNISSIGNELKFQREYYCFKNNISLPLKVNDSKKIEIKQTLQDVLYDFMQEHLGNNSELATSYEVLYAIENGKSKKKNEKYNINNYYLRMFCLFKIYGFLDSQTIMELLESYSITPSLQTSVQIQTIIQQENSAENLLKNGKIGKLLKINIKQGKIMLSKEQYISIFSPLPKELETMEKMENEQLSGKMYHIKKENDKPKITEEPFKTPLFFGYDWKEEQKVLIGKMKNLSNIEKYCLSLELGRETTYINNFINNTLQNVSIDTVLRTLDYFKMNNYQVYNILLKLKNHLSKESFKFSSIITV